MKRDTMPQEAQGAQPDDGSLSMPSAEGALRRELAQLGEWLEDQGIDLRSDQPHADDGSRDRLYWRYGYFVGLKHALSLLSSSAATLH